MMDMLPQIFLLIAAVGIIGYIWAKRSNIGAVGSLYGRYHQPNSLVIDLNDGFVARGAGEQTIQPKKNGHSIANFNMGWMNWQQKDNIPDEAILYTRPPECKQTEGIYWILPYDENGAIAKALNTGKQLQEITFLKNNNNILKQSITQLYAAIQQGVSPTIMEQKLRKAMELLKEARAETKESKAGRTLIETAGIKEEKTKPATKAV